MDGPSMVIHLKPIATPFKVRGPKPIPLPLRERVKKMLDDLESQGVIQKISKPTEWVHPMRQIQPPGDEALAGIDNMEKVVDDIILYDSSMHLHEQIVRKLLDHCRDTGITLNPKKFHYGQTEAKLAGFRVTSQSIQADPEKIKAIAQFPTPKNISDLRSFIGLIEQLAGFSDTVSAKFMPLRPLLSPKNPYIWTEDHLRAFKEVKKCLVSPPLLTTFDPKRGTMIQTDASRLNNLGYILLQKDEQDVWKLIEFGSRFVTETEAHYAMFWKRGKDNGMADALSRSPVDKPPQGDHDFTLDMYGSIHTITANLLDTFNNSYISQIECNPITLESIAHNILGKMENHNINPVLKLYSKILPHLTIDDDLILFGDKIFIPQLKRDQILQRLHSSHQGTENTFFWPGITADIRNIIEACEECQTRRSSLTKEPLKSDPAPIDVFQEIATDFFEVRGKHYLAIVDRYSNFLLVHKFSSAPTSKSFISSLLHHIATFGRPNTPLRHGTLSPSQIVFGRPMRSRLPAHNLSLAEDWQERLNKHDRHIAKQHEYAKNQYNKTSNELKPIRIGSKVWIQDPTSKIWDWTATVQGKKQDREYLLLLPSGRTLCRNRRFIRILRTRKDIITTPQCESTLKDNSQTDEPSNPQRPKRLRFAPIKFTASD
ncbi:unnamed protein product [Lepeophtheirus salmonis]|uniref:RNA-directed DNA polymerase n=1 Tax=Lepeophtheirus salmonis TaxID=72036 RepID=A0A7R8H8Q8_LEPSM|nr:unnamed protein product [Lepeophtheirus salmonis]CAF2935231.1 unnamed protein product [Lepeophtheirus salmonis]